MSAAPVITAAFDGDKGFGLQVAKKARLREGSSGVLDEGEGVPFVEAMIPRAGRTSDFDSHVACLREQFSSVSEALVSSILESTGDKPDQARCLLSQILAANPLRSERPWAKRRRSMSPEDEVEVTSVPASDRSRMISQWLESVIRRLHTARTQEDVIERLRPAVEELLWHHQELTPSRSTNKVQKILSRAILSQTDKIATLESSVQSRKSEVELLKSQVCEMQRRLDEADNLNRKLRRDNGWLYHYIRCQQDSPPAFQHPGRDIY